MMVMPSNNTGLTVGHMAGRFPERIGLLMSPGGWRRLRSRAGNEDGEGYYAHRAGRVQAGC